MKTRSTRTRRRIAAVFASGALVILGGGYAFAARNHETAATSELTTLAGDVSVNDEDATEIDEPLADEDVGDDAVDETETETPEPAETPEAADTSEPAETPDAENEQGDDNEQADDNDQGETEQVDRPKATAKPKPKTTARDEDGDHASSGSSEHEGDQAEQDDGEGEGGD